ncbi:MAG TPA: hypothetical protein VF950_25230 [Planctomycetota bacterium]
MKALLWSAAAVALSIIVLLVLAMSPPELAPASGNCPSCKTSLTTVEYGLQGIGGSSIPVIDRVTVDGCAFDLRRNPDGRLVLVGGCVIPPPETGAVCLSCRRTWVVDWDAFKVPRNSGFLWQLRGGLMRLL